MITKESFNRLVTSRKIWGAFIGSGFISLVVYMDTQHTASAITTFGILWGAAIAGQAAHDYIKGKK